MLELRLEQGSLILLQKVLESVKELFSDANFHYSSSGFAVQATDTTSNALVMLRLESTGFADYKCDTSISMGMNLSILSTMLNCAWKDDTLKLITDKGRETVTFIFQRTTGAKIELEMNLIGSRDLGIPEEVLKRFNADSDLTQLPVDVSSTSEDDVQIFFHMTLKRHDAIVTMPSAKFAWICKLLSVIGDTVVISVTNDAELKFSAEGFDFGDANMVFGQNTTPDNSTIIKMEKPVSLAVSLTYLKSFTKVTALSRTVTIRLTAELPVIVEYKIDEMEGCIRFYLSPEELFIPKIDEGDEGDED